MNEEHVAGTGPAIALGRSGFFNWLLGRAELARAEEYAAQFGREQRECLRRAKLALEMGELALAPGNVVRSGSTAAVAADLFRQAIYWALLSQRAGSGRPAPADVWADADPSLRELVAVSEDERVQIATAMGSTFVELGVGAAELQAGVAGLLRRVARGLIQHAQAPIWRLEWIKLKRLVRLGVLAVALVSCVAFTLVRALKKPDLAAGKPWRTSSVGLVCHPEISECGGAATDIFFHTQLEDNPWFEYDFGAPISFSSLTIKNRSDFGLERAVPLVVEVSEDEHAFREIARRTEVFRTWRPSFPTQHARYLRLRVPRESYLHLEAVRVHP